MRKTWIGVVLLIVLTGSLAWAEDMPRVATYTLDVTYVAGESTLEARADVSMEKATVVSQHLTFYLHGELWVDEVRADGEPVEVTQELVFYPSDYSSVARRWRIELPGDEIPKVVSIRYSGKLNPSVARAPSNYMRVDTDGVFLRSYPYSVWFPVFLEAGQDTYPVDVDATIRTPQEFMAVVTGERLGEKVEEGFRVSHWRAVHDDLFNIQLTVREFELLQDGGFHLYFLRDEVSRANAARILEFTAKLEKFYRANYAEGDEGAQLHVVQMPRFGDISSGNMVGISDAVWRDFDPASYSGRTLAHELVHPYVQMPLPSSSNMYALVIEGFPSYFYLPAMGEILGEDFYRQMMTQTEDLYLERRRTGLDRRGRPLPVEKPILALTAEDISNYKDRFVLNDRTRLFCNWLRNRMGVETFKKFTLELFAQESLDPSRLIAIIETNLPGSSEDVNLWLGTTDFPERFRLHRSTSGG